MTIKKAYTINITAEYGSDFQEESASKGLVVMVQAWEMFYNKQHQNNKIMCEILEKTL
jgi:hypothetical protein